MDDFWPSKFLFGEGCEQLPLHFVECSWPVGCLASPTRSLCGKLGLSRSSRGVVCLAGVGRNTQHLGRSPHFYVLFLHLQMSYTHVTTSNKTDSHECKWEQCGQWPGESGESSSIHVPAREMSVVTGVGGACAELLKVLEGMGCCSKTSLSICATRDVCPLQPPHSLSLLCPFHPLSFRLLCRTRLLEADPKNLPHPG